MFLWVDDVRPAPSDKFIWVQSTAQAINTIAQCRKQRPTEQIVVDLDHDSGLFYNYGGDYIKVLEWLEQQGIDDVAIHLHTMNPVGRENMRRIILHNGWKQLYRMEY